jgi:Plasmid pRiA4b ORF-3-like protein
MRNLTLTKEQEQLLRAQVIDGQQPGTVLRDFQTVLDFVGVGGVKAAGKYNLLPLDSLGELNQRLGRPLQLQLKRPQLRSHPYLQGLHLLLRASTLTRVEGVGAKDRLVVDPLLLQQWNALNPTERYFNLLEAWLRFGREEMVGERGRGVLGSLFECLSTWSHLDARGMTFDPKRSQGAYLPVVGRELYLLALLDLFGLLAVEQARSPLPRWCPASVKHCPFGDALLTLLAQNTFIFGGKEDGLEEEEPDTPAFGRWQPIFQPYFPQWRNNLVPPAPKAQKGTYIFRVSLGKVWRRLALPARASLDELAGWILNSVNFDDDHLYQFTYRDRLGGNTQVSHPYCEESPATDEVSLGELPLQPGESMAFLFDFGDSWRFTVKLESIEPPQKKIKAPRILEKHGKAPEQYPNADW